MGRLNSLWITLLLGLAACSPRAHYPHPGFREVYDHRNGDAPVLRLAGGDRFRAIRIEVTVDPAGKVVAARRIGEAPKGGAAAVALMRGQTYKPFFRDGKPVAVRFEDYVRVLPLERLPSRKIPFPTGEGPVRVWLERSGCFGRCPAYRVEIAGDGRVVFKGYRFTLAPGEHVTSIPPEQVASLVARFRSADFFSLDPQYKLNVTDHSTYVLGIETGGTTKEVVDYMGLEAGMPQSVHDLEMAIDEAAGTDTWTVGNARTLVAARIDPGSAEAGEMLATAAETSPEPFLLALIAGGAPLGVVTDDRVAHSVWQGVAERDSLPVMRALIAKSGSWRPPQAVLDEALAAAALYGSVDMVRLLIEFQPVVNSPGGREALCQAAERIPMIGGSDAIPVASALLKAGVDPGRGPPFTSRSALFCARTSEMVRLLVGAGARLEARNEMGDTPLLSASNEDTALALISAGADVDARSPQGRTIGDIARERSWWRVRFQLLRRRLLPAR